MVKYTSHLWLAPTPGSSVPLLPSSLELGPQVQGRAEVSWKHGVDSTLPQTGPVALSHPGSQARPPAHFITGPERAAGPMEAVLSTRGGKIPS